MQTVNPDQTAHSVASDLCLYCLPVSLLWDVMHKWVNFWKLIGFLLESNADCCFFCFFFVSTFCYAAAFVY